MPKKKCSDIFLHRTLQRSPRNHWKSWPARLAGFFSSPRHHRQGRRRHKQRLLRRVGRAAEQGDNNTVPPAPSCAGRPFTSHESLLALRALRTPLTRKSHDTAIRKFLDVCFGLSCKRAPRRMCATSSRDTAVGSRSGQVACLRQDELEDSSI